MNADTKGLEHRNDVEDEAVTILCKDDGKRVRLGHGVVEEDLGVPLAHGEEVLRGEFLECGGVGHALWGQLTLGAKCADVVLEAVDRGGKRGLRDARERVVVERGAWSAEGGTIRGEGGRGDAADDGYRGYEGHGGAV